MKLSSKSKYGLKACFVLADEGGVIPLTRLAISTESTEPYLEQILMALRRGGIIKAVRGASGGYALEKPADQTTVGEILRVLEDGFEFIDCLSGKCHHKGKCPTRTIWHKLYTSINDCLNGITLADMVKDFHAEVEDLK